MSPDLSQDAIELLEWIDRHPHNKSAWLSKGRHELAGEHGSIIVSEGAWFTALPYFEPNQPDYRPAIFRLNEPGRAALAEHRSRLK